MDRMLLCRNHPGATPTARVEPRLAVAVRVLQLKGFKARDLKGSGLKDLALQLKQHLQVREDVTLGDVCTPSTEEILQWIDCPILNSTVQAWKDSRACLSFVTTVQGIVKVQLCIHVSLYVVSLKYNI